MKLVQDLELMVPIGSYEALAAAIRSGAGAVYFGVDKLNMRSRAASPFTLQDLKKIARICRWCDVRSYLALNTLVYDEDLPTVQAICRAAADAGVSAVICTDISAIQEARRTGLEVHMSVQANVSNIEAVRFYAQWADVIVLARELTLEQIRAICDTVQNEPICGPSGQPVKIELFVHGAICVAVSGKCWMSLAYYNQSANRGACFQPCRRRYHVTDAETGADFEVDNEFVMSPKDLCTIEHLDRILETGVSVLKIEGRGRKPDYVATVTEVYKEALQAIEAGTYGPDCFPSWIERLASVFNRGFWQGGYYCGEKLGEWSASGHSQATKTRVQLGIVSNFYKKPSVMEFTIWKAGFREGDELLVEGTKTGSVAFVAENILVNDQPVLEACQGDRVTVRTPVRVRRNDKVFVYENRDDA